MRSSLFAGFACCLLAAGAARAPDAQHVDASFSLDAELLNGRWVDLEGDGELELILSTLDEGGGRELRIHRWGTDGLLNPVATQRVPVKKDVLAWAVADVRDEAGKELVFLTRSGAYSYSLQHPGYGNNIRRLVESDLFFDIVNQRDLPEWRYVLPRTAGDALLLPGPSGLAVWGPGTSSDATYVLECDLLHSEPAGLSREQEEQARVEISATSLLLSTNGGVGQRGQFPSSVGELPWQAFLSTAHELHAPALVDVDGDGRIDLVRRDKERLLVHLCGAQGIPTRPTRVEPYPEVMKSETLRRDLAFHDLDADGDADILVRLRGERGGLAVGEISVRFLIMLNDGERLLHEKPQQVLSFDAMRVAAEVADLNADGSPDLVMAKFGAPGLGNLLTLADGLKFTRTSLAFFGLGKGKFSRSPDLDPPPITYDEQSIQGAVSRRRLTHDFDGDGIADLVELDFSGAVSIQRVKRESGFFSGETWELEQTPWKRFDVRGDMRDIQTDDVNGDGIGDVVSLGKNGVTLLVSRRPGGGR